jgi:hypothetical protein
VAIAAARGALQQTVTVPILTRITPAPRIVVALGLLLLPIAARGEGDAPRAVETSLSQPGLQSPDVAKMAGVLDAQLGNARLWYWGWSGFYSAVIVGESVINATSTGPMQVSAQVNIFTSVFGLFSTLILPPPVVFDWEPIGRMPENTPEQRLQKAAAIRALFQKESTKERFYHSVWNHILGLAVNAGVCAYMYWGLHIGGRALLNLFFGSLVWEANIFTSPNASARAATELEKTSAVQLQLVPVALGPSGAGLAVVGRF